MKKSLLFLRVMFTVIFFSEIPSLTSQSFLYHQQLSFDLGKDVQNFTITPASDGGYLVAECFNQSWPNPDHGLALMKMDQDYIMVWATITYSDDTWTGFRAEDIKECASGEIVVCGSALSSQFAQPTGFIALFDPNGNNLWFKVYYPHNSFNAIAEVPGYQYFITYGQAYNNATGQYSGTIMATDYAGVPNWSWHIACPNDSAHTGYEELVLNDDGVWAVGNYNYRPSIQNPLHSEILLSQFAFDGGVNFHRKYTHASDSLFDYQLVAKSLVNADTAIYITGALFADSLLTDSLYPDSVIGMVRLWQDVLGLGVNVYSGSPWWLSGFHTGLQNPPTVYDEDEWGEQIIMHNGFPVICGHSNTDHSGTMNRDGLFLPVRTTGTPFRHTHFGDSLTDYFFDMALENDTFVLAGYTNSRSINHYDLYLVERLPSVTDTCLFLTHYTPYTPIVPVADSLFEEPLQFCDSLIKGTIKEIKVKRMVWCPKTPTPKPRIGKVSVTDPGYTLYPNPATGSIFFNGPSGAEIIITDPSGRTAKRIVVTPGATIAVDELSHGLWYFRIITPTGESNTLKISIL